MREKRITVWVQRFKDRPFLMLQWIDPESGRRRSKSAETTDEKAADQARADLEYELNNGKHHDPSRLQWERFRQMFQDEYTPGLRPRTQEKYGTVFDVFEQIVHPEKLRAITERTISAFVKGMRERKKRSGKIGLAPHTIKNYLIALKVAFGWAVEQRLLPEMPTFPTIKVPKKKPQPIPAESFEKLIEKAPDASWKAFLMLGWWAGLRLSEAHQLRWDRTDEFPWIDFEASRIILPAAFVKADTDQWVPLHPVLRQTLAALPRDGSSNVFRFPSRQGGFLTRSAVTNRILLLAKQAGVKLSMQKLRKGFGCRVAQQLGKGNAPILHTLMRHSSMQITMDFYAAVDPILHDAMEGLK